MRGAHVAVPIGAEAIIRTGGGGGWGDPLERDPLAVAGDVREELISVESARRDYGVVLGAGGAPDQESTARLRAASKAGKAVVGKGL